MTKSKKYSTLYSALDSPNNPLKDLRHHADKAFNNGDFLEAAIMGFAEIEFVTRFLMLRYCEINLKSDSKIATKINDVKTPFSAIIDYFELTSQDSIFCNQLRKFNEQRNNNLHNLFSFSDKKKDLIEGCKSLMKQRDAISKKLHEFIRDNIKK